MRACRFLPFLSLFVAGCGSSIDAMGPVADVPPESDAGVPLEPDADAFVPRDGRLVRVTALPGAEELAAVSPDGRWVAFVAGATGLAAVWAAPMPADGGDPLPPVQLTNVGLERVPRVAGQPPPGFVPAPDSAAGLRWVDDRTVGWTAGGVAYSARVPR